MSSVCFCVVLFLFVSCSCGWLLCTSSSFCLFLLLVFWFCLFFGLCFDCDCLYNLFMRGEDTTVVRFFRNIPYINSTCMVFRGKSRTNAHVRLNRFGLNFSPTQPKPKT